MQIGQDFVAPAGGTQRIAWVVYDPLTETYVTDESGNRLEFSTDNDAYRSGLGQVQPVWKS